MEPDVDAYTARNTPEHRLWQAVLNTWVEEAVHTWSPSKIELLRVQPRNRWTQEICEWTGLDYSWYIEMINRVLTTRMRAIKLAWRLEERIRGEKDDGRKLQLRERLARVRQADRSRFARGRGRGRKPDEYD